MARFSILRLWALALVLALPLSGCRMLGMRNAPPGWLEKRYENADSRYLTIDGTKIHYRIEGNQNGPTLILLHGVMASLQTWDGWVNQLSGRYRIVRMDLPGFGLSDNLASDDYTPEYAVKFFEMARQELGLDKFHLAGNSLGGFIAWAYAAQYPEHVEKLILIDPIAYPQPLPRIIKFASGSFGGFMAQISSPRFIVKRNVRQVYGDPDTVTAETIDRYHDLLLHEGHREAMVKYFRTLKKYSADESFAELVRKVQTPTLLMWGGKDRWVPIELIERWKHDVKGIKVVVVDGGGHIPMEEFPESTARDADAFLNDGASGGAMADWGGSEAEAEAPETAEQASAGQPAWGETEAGDDDLGSSEEAPPAPVPPPQTAPAKKKPPANNDGMVGWGEFGEM